MWRKGLIVWGIIAIFNISGAHADNDSLGLKKELRARLTVSQVSLANWAAGGENALSYALYVDTGLQNHQPRFEWILHGKFSFGQTRINSDEVRNSIDKVACDAVFTLKKKKFVNPCFSISLNTQFAAGYDYTKEPKQAKSDFWDPAFLVQSVGTGVQFNKYVRSRLGVAVKETFTKHFTVYSDNPKTKNVEKTKVEPGCNSRSDLQVSFNQNLKFDSCLEIFYNFETIREVDVRWDSRLNAKVAKYFSVALNLYLYYDSDVSSRGQWKETMEMGLAYNFF